MDRGAWRATVHGVTESQTSLSGKAAEALAGGSVCPQCSKFQACQGHGQHQEETVEADMGPDGSLYSDSRDPPPPLPPSSSGLGNKG